MGDENQFAQEDYWVFSASLLLSLSIGFFFTWYSWRRSTTEEYLHGGGEMNPVAVGLSMTASVMNAIFLIGIPAEIYYYGAVYAWLGVAFIVNLIIACLIFIPFYRHHNFLSIHQYLGERFNSIAVRTLVSLTFTVSMIFFLAVVLYTPALAFEAVTGLSIHITQIACGLVCTTYVAFGGFRAVVWTDTIQMLIIIGGTLTIAIMGANRIEGDQNYWEIAEEDNRINFNKDDSDLTEQHTVWTQCIGQIFNWLPIMVANQMVVQRYSAVSSNTRAWIAACVSIGVTLFLLAMVTVCGLVMYATFRDCDRYVVKKEVDKPDQLFPLLVMIVLGDYKGLPGLYVAAVFAAALSSVSSAINSLAAVFLEDFIKPLHSHFATREKATIDEKSATRITRILSLLFGLMAIGLSYLAPHMGDELIGIPATIWGSFMAPVLGVFVLAMFFPWANAIGVICALLLTLTFSMWMTVGGILHSRDRVPIMPIGLCTGPPMEMNGTEYNSTEGILNTEGYYTSTEHDTTTVTTMMGGAEPILKTTEEPALEDFYSLSYAWYGLVNLVMCVVLGIIISLCVNLISHGCLGVKTTSETGEVNDWWYWFNNHVLKGGSPSERSYKDTEQATQENLELPDRQTDVFQNELSNNGHHTHADNHGYISENKQYNT